MVASRTAALVILCAIPIFSQATQTASDKSPEIASHDAPATFAAKINLVMVPVVVRDKTGHAIGTLKKEDFQLFDKGKPQVISKFTIEKADGRVAPLEVTAKDPDLEQGAAKTPEGPPAASRFVAYLFDDMHTSFGDLAQARVAAAKHLAESLKGADRAAIFTTSGQTALDFTDDREKLTKTMNRIMPRSRQRTGECPDASDYLADQIENKNDSMAALSVLLETMGCGGTGSTPAPAPSPSAALSAMKPWAQGVLRITDADTQIALDVLKAAVQRLAVMPGQRTIVLVSGGFLVTITNGQEEVELIDRAIRANVIISSLDARGLYAIVPGGDASVRNTSLAATSTKARYDVAAAEAQAAVLEDLADGTGGIFFHNNNDLQEGFRRTGATPEFMYVLGFSPQNLKFDGSFHALKVTAKETRDVTLQVRRGYYAPRHSTTPTEDAKEEIRGAVFSRDEISDIPVELHTQFFKSSDRSARLSVVAHVDLKHLRFKKQDGRNRNTLTIVSAVFDRNGVLVGAIQKEIDIRFRDESFEAWLANGVALKTSFDVAPGDYVVRLVVRDSEGEAMAARNGVVEIP